MTAFTYLPVSKKAKILAAISKAARTEIEVVGGNIRKVGETGSDADFADILLNNMAELLAEFKL